MSGGRVIDITPPVRTGEPRTAVFPGDTEPSREVLMDIDQGAHLTLSTFRSTVHVGAHADGENHYKAGGRSIDRMPIEHYLGLCDVIDVSGVIPGEGERAQGYRVSEADVFGDRPYNEVVTQRRVLIRTDTQPDKTVFPQTFAGLEPALVEVLAGLGVMTVGIDTPSVDVASSKDLPAHAAFARCNIAIIEGLELRDVQAGVYELIAPPLALVGFDASPVRALLRTVE